LIEIFSATKAPRHKEKLTTDFTDFTDFILATEHTEATEVFGRDAFCGRAFSRSELL